MRRNIIGLTIHNNKVHLSVVSPVYRAELIVDELVKRLQATLGTITESYEIILVEDCGPDNSWDKIAENCQKDTRIKGVKLSRNFGQHHAITAGLDHCRGEWIIVMDCDLQDQPEEIPKLYQKALEGYDVVFAERANRQDGFFKKLNSKLFRIFFQWLSGIQVNNSIANFGVYHSKVINAVLRFKEPMRDFGPMVKWVGFKTTTVDVKHASRYEGKSSYTFSKLVNLALNTILAYSDKPLRLTVKLGMGISFFAFLFALYNLEQYLSGKIQQPGFTTIITSIWLLGGLIIFLIGIVGLYISKIFEATKNRPLYVIDKQINHHHEN